MRDTPIAWWEWVLTALPILVIIGLWFESQRGVKPKRDRIPFKSDMWL